ncbi:hydantoinase/oxoprolinase family protein [Aromatoleum toluclasticum]|uniref:hydantoinase/oxoprolinase family protein n=1 Tax=Aromatoleum toluclasticum TaxID=92003 RepID=UPI001D190C9B|nr:hydantoinase/oxoprolinase family protein [Aromatoleum toluclasticum]MCC4116547.1 hydantoinase/oxoprolinase family protein [Aromatoleum toluclasticum]
MARIGVDVGGTFTDLVLEVEGEEQGKHRVYVHKVPSTPWDQSEGVLRGILEICRIGGIYPSDVRLIVHGTTVATNITIEHNGAEVGMLTTRGFRDILHIGRHKRPENFSLQFDVPWQSRPLVKRRNRIAISERVMPPHGDVAQALDEDEVRAAAELFKARGIKSVIVCFLYSFLNNTHERRAKEIIREVLPDAYVSCSSEVANVIREYERFSTTAMNAYVGPKTSLYLKNLEEKLLDAGIKAHLRIMQSNGGVSTVEKCSSEAVSILMSGLAGGVMGGRWAGSLSDEKNIITVDIGGTSADFSTIPDGKVKIMNPRDTYVGAYPILAPMIDLATMGAGGGSIAYIDEGGAFRVGPRSAGADPGPACYGKGGTEPTVTDAQVVLGRLDPDHFLGGGIEIDAELAREAIRTKVAEPLGLTVEEAALGIIRILNSNMSLAIRANSVAKGFDPRKFALAPFGGAGPLNGVALAEAVSAREVIVPPAPGITAAIGLLVTDMQYEFMRSVPTLLKDVEQPALDKLNRVIDELSALCRERLDDDGVPADNQHFVRIAECRYHGQGFELRADIPEGRIDGEKLAAVKANFQAQHKRDYGWAFDDVDVEIVTIRIIGIAHTRPLAWPELEDAAGSGPEAALMYERPTIFDDRQTYATPRYDRKKLKAGHELPGPAIIVQHDSTTLVPPGYVAKVSGKGNIHINAQRV